MRASRHRRFLFSFQCSGRHHSSCESNWGRLPTIAHVVRRENAPTEFAILPELLRAPIVVIWRTTKTIFASILAKSVTAVALDCVRAG